MLTKVRVWYDEVKVEYFKDYVDIVLSIDEEEFDGMTDEDIDESIIEEAKEKFIKEYKYPADFDSEHISISLVDSDETYININNKTKITQRDCPGTNDQTMDIFENIKE